MMRVLSGLVFLSMNSFVGAHLRSRQAGTGNGEATTDENLMHPHRRLLQKVEDTIASFQQAKGRLITRLQADYGPNSFQTLFVDVHPTSPIRKASIGRGAFYNGTDNGDLAWEHAKRKMEIRILDSMIKGQTSNFVWATAGDSGAAGHGNFFDEQYTQVLQRQGEDLLKSVGLQLVTRPYGMHSATSAPEVANCVKEIFGMDVDLITWDFATADGRWHWRLEYFAHRVMLLPKHPTMLVLRAGLDTERKAVVEKLAKLGMAALRLDEQYSIRQLSKFPNSHYATEAELAAMTDHTRYFRCGRTIEAGPGGCDEHKFTRNGTCDDREGQTNWHHGWKWHAYYGNLYTLFLMELIDDALQSIKKFGTGGLETYQKTLMDEEEQIFNRFESLKQFLYPDRWNMDTLKTSMFYHQRSYCHTARLPAETRYKGFVFDKDLRFRNDDWNNFKRGFPVKRLNQEPLPELHLAYSPTEQHGCNATLHIDSRDFFYATPWAPDFQTVTIPNTQEFKHYGPHKPIGVIAMCTAACTHSNCQGLKMLNLAEINEGQHITVQVNGEDVGKAKRFDDCLILQRKDGSYYWPANGDGRYEIGVKIFHTQKYFRASSFILW